MAVSTSSQRQRPTGRHGATIIPKGLLLLLLLAVLAGDCFISGTAYAFEVPMNSRRLLSREPARPDVGTPPIDGKGIIGGNPNCGDNGDCREFEEPPPASPSPPPPAEGDQGP